MLAKTVAVEATGSSTSGHERNDTDFFRHDNLASFGIPSGYPNPFAVSLWQGNLKPLEGFLHGSKNLKLNSQFCNLNHNLLD